MRKQIICFVGLAIAIYASTAYAEDCEVRPSNLDDFGHHRLGQRLKALPKGVKRLPNCAVYRKYHTFDCEFVDAYGNSYLASGHEIVKLERVPVKSYSRPLPRPLRFGMTIEEATSALTAMDPKINLTTDHSDGGSSLDTGECLKDRHGVTYFLSLQFDEAGGLSKVTAAFDTAED